MLFGKKPYPILPTSESDTLTFLQKLDLLEYKVAEMSNKIYEIETTLATKSTVSATADGDVIQTLTIDGETLDVPQGTEVSATDDDGVLQTLTIGDETYTVPQGTEVSATDDDGVLQTLTIGDDTYTVPQSGEAGEKGGGAIGGNSFIQWRLVNDIFALEITYAAGTDAFVNDGIAIRLTDSDNHNYSGLDGKTLKTNAAWIYKVNTDIYYFVGTVQLSIVSDGLGTLSFPDGYYVDPDLTPISDSTLLQTIKHRPFVFINVPTL